MKAEKTNMDYLYEFIKDNDEAKEFWEAVDVDIADLKDECKILKETNASLNSQLTELLEEPVLDLQTLDFGFGVIDFVYPDNLKLQGSMDELKNNPEKLLQFE